MSASKVHELKIVTEHFHAVADGRKTFEVRNNDRGFGIGDVLILREWSEAFEPDHLPRGAHYTGRWCARVVSFVAQGDDYLLSPGFAVLGFELADGSSFVSTGEAVDFWSEIQNRKAQSSALRSTD